MKLPEIKLPKIDLKVWLLIACLVFLSMFLQQCNKTRNIKQDLIEAQRIADQNLKAMSDSAVQLKMTRKQLAEADSTLSATVIEADRIIRELGSKKDKVREVVRTKIIIKTDSASVKNDVAVDPTNSSKYNLVFSVNDSIKSFNGVSSFYVNKIDNDISIKGDSTKIKNFKLNFELVLIKYDDASQKVTKYKIIPYYITSTGAMVPLSENQIKLNYRGVELLDQPWKENTPGQIGVKKKLRLEGTWGLGVNPIGVGLDLNNGKIRYTPSISVGYFITLKKK